MEVAKQIAKEIPFYISMFASYFTWSPLYLSPKSYKERMYALKRVVIYFFISSVWIEYNVIKSPIVLTRHVLSKTSNNKNTDFTLPQTLPKPLSLNQLI